MSHALLVVALPAEARPLIDRFGLQLQSQRPFRQYRSEHITLVECGIGKLAAAAGTAAALEALSDHNAYCINIGIAGADKAIGDLFAAHQILDRGTQKSWYPQLTRMPVTDTIVVETVDQPDTQYQPDRAYDMEAAGFFEAATRYTSLEFIHCLKIISDNSTTPLSSLNKQKVTELVAEHISTIERVLSELEALSLSLPSAQVVTAEIERLTQKIHLTVSQRADLHQLLLRHTALHGSPPVLATENTNAKNLLAELKIALDAHRQKY